MPIRVAVVTGGVSGMGRAHAIGLAQAGFNVTVFDSQNPSDSVLEEVGVSWISTDVREENDIEEATRAVLLRYGRIDVLVNNAGGASSSMACEDCSLDDWERTLRLNLTGPFLCIRAALPTMKRQRSGRIINVATTSVFSGTTAGLYRNGANLVPYVAAKGGIVGMTTALAREVASWNITVNAIAPGFTPTPRVLATFPKDAMDQMVKDQALRKLLEPHDATGMVVLLAGESASMITGQVIRIDGGTVMG